MTELIPSVGPPSFGQASELYGVMEEVLRSAGIRPGEKIVILTDTREDKSIIDAFFAAGLALGADVRVLTGRPMKSLDDPPTWIIDFLKNVDLVINLQTMEWGKQKGAKELEKAGVRVIMCVERVDTLLKMRPSEVVRKRVEKMVKLIEASREVHIWSAAGTDLTWKKGDGRVTFLNGLLDTQRKILWTNFPNSVVSFPFEPATGSGTLVIEPGDVLIHLRHMVREPIRIRIEKSRITKIEGGFDANILNRNWFDRWNDSKAYDLLHLSFGCDHRTELHPNVYAPMEWESYAGGVGFGWGPTVHLDVMVANHNVSFDDSAIIKNGKMVHPDLL